MRHNDAFAREPAWTNGPVRLKDLEAQTLKSSVHANTALVTAAITAIAGLIVVLSFSPNLRAYTVQGGSMQPVYNQGDLILTSSASADSVRPGQIIVFVADWASEKYDHRVVHRVAAVGDIDGLPIAYTRGDANLIADPQPVDLRGDVRVVRLRIPAGGVLVDLLAGPFLAAGLATLSAGLLGAIFSIGLPTIGSNLRQLWRTPRTRPVAQATDPRFPY